MERSKFDELWNNIIYSTAVNLEENNKNSLTFDSSKKERIYSHYENYRKQYKSEWFVKEGRIDRHKIASFMICAIVTEEPMKIKSNEKNPFEVRASNEMLAILSGISILKSFIIEDFNYSQPKPPDDYIENFAKEGIKFPPPSDSEHYLLQLSRDIYLCRCQNRKTRETIENRLIPMLFHVCFFLEEYHKKVYDSIYR